MPISPQNTGQRFTKLSLLQPNSDQDSFGQPDKTFLAIKSVQGQVLDLKGDEIYRGQQFNPEVNKKIIVRYGEVASQFEDGTLALYWLLDGVKYYDIQGIVTLDQRKQWIALYCVERAGFVLGAGTGQPPTAFSPWGLRTYTGAIDGVNTTFVLDQATSDATRIVILRRQIRSTGFTFTGRTCVFDDPPQVGDELRFLG